MWSRADTRVFLLCVRLVLGYRFLLSTENDFYIVVMRAVCLD